MKVTLAYPRDGHAADETVELPDAEAHQLLRDGYARPAEQAGPQNPTPENSSGPAAPTKEM